MASAKDKSGRDPQLIVPQFVQVRSTGPTSHIAFTADVAEFGNNPAGVLSELSDFLFANDSHVLIVDLREVAYLPSTMLGVLATLAKGHTDVHVTYANRDVVDVMSITNLDKLIHVHQDGGPAELMTDTVEIDVPAARPVTPPRVTAIAGYVVPCDRCQHPQQIDKHNLGKNDTCEKCQRPIHVDTEHLNAATWLYTTCPKCFANIRLSRGQLNQPMTCDACGLLLEVRKIV